MRNCPVCRTPNLVTNPLCTMCSYQFFTAKESRFKALDESGRPKSPSALGPPPAMPDEPSEFEQAPGPSPPPQYPGAASPPRYLCPVPPPAAGPGPPSARKKSRKRSTFPRVPKDLPDEALEPLRYDAMKKSLILVAILMVTSVAGSLILGLLHIAGSPIGILGIVSYIFVFVFYSYVRAVSKASKKPVSAVEQAALSKVRTGGAFLIFIPLIGSVGGQFGVYFQTNPMHPIYYALAAGGIFYTLAGVTALKERYSYFAVFEFGFLLLLVQPLPGVLPGDLATLIFGNVYWFQTTFLFLAVGFIAIAMALRKMRAGQYEALEQEVISGQKALDARQFDKALGHFDRAVTIAHSLYSDKLFKSTRTGQRILPADYYLPWVGKATALALSGRGAKALTILDIILEVDGTNADLWMNKGEVLLSLGRPAEAYIAFEAAQRLNPGIANALSNKTSALELLRRRIE
jgi:hypothetical protein